MALQTALTLGQLTDRIRRDLQIVPQFDVDGVTVGQPSVSFPDPNNATIYQAVCESIDAINSVVRVGKIVTLTVSTVPAILPGPFMVDFSGTVPDQNDVSEVLGVYWQPTNPSTALPVRLDPYDFYAPVRRYQPADPMNLDNNPQQWFQTGTQIGLMPPPNQSGTIYILQQEGLPYLINPGDTLSPFFPVNYHRAVWYYAIGILAGRTSSDVEMAARGQWFSAQAGMVLRQIYDWKNGYGQASIEAQNDLLQMIPGITRTSPVPAGPSTPENVQAGR